MKLSALFLVSAIALTACGSAKGPDKSPEEIVQEGVNNLAEVKSAEYEFSINGSAEDPKSDQNIAFDANFSGAYDNGNRDNPIFSMLIDANLDLPEDLSGEVGGELRFVDKTFYFMLSKLSDFGGQVPTEFVAPFLQKWWFMTLPEEY